MIIIFSAGRSLHQRDEKEASCIHRYLSWKYLDGHSMAGSDGVGPVEGEAHNENYLAIAASYNNLSREWRH